MCVTLGVTLCVTWQCGWWVVGGGVNQMVVGGGVMLWAVTEGILAKELEQLEVLHSPARGREP